jgi:hypothetical protein
MKRMKEARAEYGQEYLDLIESIGKREPPNRRLAYTRVLPCPDFSARK